VAIQIESTQAVANAEAIMATPGIDGCWVGPADLGLTMGLRPAEVSKSDEHHRALEKVIQACKNTGKVPGIAGGSVEDAIKKMQMGFRFVTASNDANLLLTAAAGALSTLRQAIAKL
jgi:4-hydroxy-2-oxoheptanedioate aldolase